MKEKFYKKPTVDSKIDMSQIFRPFKYKYMYTNLNDNAFTNMTNKELSRKKFSIKKKFIRGNAKRKLNTIKRQKQRTKLSKIRSKKLTGF